MNKRFQAEPRPTRDSAFKREPTPMKTLITFLGKGRPQDGGYQRTTYRFPEGTERNTAFFGLAAAEVAGVNTLRVLGTAGSMWDVFLLEHLPPEHQGDDCDQLLDELSNAVANDRVTARQIEQLENLLNRQETLRFQLRLIPYGDDPAGQIDILRAVTDGIDPAQDLYLDITHSLRHLPMLGLLAAFYLRAATGASIEGIYYGALDRRKDGVTPVLRLDGLLSLYDWIRALEQFNKDGDYSSFSNLFDREGLPGALMREAAFLERIANASSGSQKLGTAMQKINQASAISPAAGLFVPLLRERTAWHKGGDRAARERALALDYLKRRDYLRATQFGFEARVTAGVWDNRGNPNEFDDREAAERMLYERGNQNNPDQPGNFKTLKNLRNALAHGVLDTERGGRFNQFLQKITSDETLLRDWLEKTLK